MPALIRSTAEKIKAAGARRKTPLWEGPAGQGPNGGVSQSMLGLWFVCRERFRVQYVEGLKPRPKFSPALDFGTMWHLCEELHAANAGWALALATHCRKLCDVHRGQQEEIQLWHDKCAALFPVYADHWAKHPDVRDRKPLLQEQVFDVPYVLPSGRTVRLRGKWDSVDLIGKGKEAGIYLQENKTKSGIDGEKIKRQLRFDLQTMIYLISMKEHRHPETDENIEELEGHAIKGVRYNVIRRASHKSVKSMLEKLEDDRKASRMGEWFARWKVEVSLADLARFKRECLDPALENLLDDWEWWQWCWDRKEDVYGLDNRLSEFPQHSPRHFRVPYGIYNVLAEGGVGDLDGWLETGSEVGLVRSDKLFTELV